MSSIAERKRKMRAMLANATDKVMGSDSINQKAKADLLRMPILVLGFSKSMKMLYGIVLEDSKAPYVGKRALVKLSDGGELTADEYEDVAGLQEKVDKDKEVKGLSCEFKSYDTLYRFRNRTQNRMLKPGVIIYADVNAGMWRDEGTKNGKVPTHRIIWSPAVEAIHAVVEVPSPAIMAFAYAHPLFPSAFQTKAAAYLEQLAELGESAPERERKEVQYRDDNTYLIALGNFLVANDLTRENHMCAELKRLDDPMSFYASLKHTPKLILEMEAKMWAGGAFDGDFDRACQVVAPVFGEDNAGLCQIPSAEHWTALMTADQECESPLAAHLPILYGGYEDASKSVESEHTKRRAEESIDVGDLDHINARYVDDDGNLSLSFRLNLQPRFAFVDLLGFLRRAAVPMSAAKIIEYWKGKTMAPSHPLMARSFNPNDEIVCLNMVAGDLSYFLKQNAAKYEFRVLLNIFFKDPDEFGYDAVAAADVATGDQLFDMFLACGGTSKLKHKKYIEDHDATLRADSLLRQCKFKMTKMPKLKIDNVDKQLDFAKSVVIYAINTEAVDSIYEKCRQGINDLKSKHGLVFPTPDAALANPAWQSENGKRARVGGDADAAAEPELKKARSDDGDGDSNDNESADDNVMSDD